MEAGHFLEGMNWLSGAGKESCSPGRSEGCPGDLSVDEWLESFPVLYGPESQVRQKSRDGNQRVPFPVLPGQESSFGWENINFYIP